MGVFRPRQVQAAIAAGGGQRARFQAFPIRAHLAYH